MEYSFDEEKFKDSFNAKTSEEKSVDSIRITHKADNAFKLFPYKASGKRQAPIVIELKEVVSAFFREVMKKETDSINFDEFCIDILKEVEVEEEDLEYFKDMLYSIFFKNGSFVADNLGLYPYQATNNNKSVENLAHFLFSVFGLNEFDCERIEDAKKKYRFSVLENLVIQTFEKKKVLDAEEKIPYFSVRSDIQEKFKEDFYYMLDSGMTSLEDMSNLFAIYYFYYISQTCITLDQYCDGKRDKPTELYFALDWERVSKNRKCCTNGWEQLQNNIKHMFGHAITLEILNQSKNVGMMDYISFGDYIRKYPEKDDTIAKEIMRAEEVYKSFVGDCKRFNEIPNEIGSSETEKAIKHLYECVEMQFLDTDRKRAYQFYYEKFLEFSKNRWIKNRKKSGLVLNLTERDIIFLTKISLRNNEKIRLNDLFIQFKHRGFCLDNTSKEYLQEFFTKLNLIDKKSDSGDAQYVKRIL